MASIQKTDTGKWRVRVRVGGVYKSGTFRTKAEAVSWANSQESDISAGKAGVVPNKTFADVVNKYLAEVVPTKRGARVERHRLWRMMGIGEARDGSERDPDPICKVRLVDLGPEDFAAWRDRRLRLVSAASVRREWAALSNMLNLAIKEWRWLQVNPLVSVKKPEPPKARTRRYSQDEIDRLLLATGYGYDAPPLTVMSRVGAAMLFALETAMRAGEIVGLVWPHVDFERRLAHLPLTKNGHARDVPLSKEAIRILRQLEQIKAGESVFQIESAQLDALFRKAKARALIEDLHFHDTRREALTRLAKKVDVMTLAKISGHRDLRILQNTYYAPDMADVAALLD